MPDTPYKKELSTYTRYISTATKANIHTVSYNYTPKITLHYKHHYYKTQKYRTSRKFDVELNLAVDDFLWKSPNLIRQLQIQWCFIIQCDPRTAKFNIVKVIRY